MRIEEPSSFPPESDTIIAPIYRVDFWSLDPGLVVNTVRVHDARDVHEVENWAKRQRRSQYIIYSEVQATQNAVIYVRVAGFEPFITDAPVEHFISDPAEVELVRKLIET
ncbi:hypothetical protein ACL9RL_00290 [Plantibacter sp. Mn2098]|uniref:hypothetical protein n=1 Tax=Plantibacter sp. Mn2098 TaxID=3395266 RepID=UPI003BBE90FF